MRLVLAFRRGLRVSAARCSMVLLRTGMALRTRYHPSYRMHLLKSLSVETIAKYWLIGLSFWMLAGCSDTNSSAPSVLRLAVTTSTRDSGVLEQIIPEFASNKLLQTSETETPQNIIQLKEYTN